jgi:DnaJ-class molecular chaperone
MECGHCDGTGKHGDKDCKKCDGTGEAQEDDDSMNNESKVEETTSSGSVATSEAGGKALYKNASVYESNEIVKRAKQLNEDMSFTVSGGPDQEPTLNINASGAEAQQLGQLLKLSGLGMKPAAPQYGEVEIQVAEDQEFANGADDENTMDTEYMTQDIAGGLNGPKKMAYPKVAGGDNPMAVLEASELNEVGEDRLMKLYQAYKAK